MFIVCVWFGCNAKEANVCKAFKSYRDAVALYSIYAERAQTGEWFERVELDHLPYEEMVQEYCQQKFNMLAEIELV